MMFIELSLPGIFLQLIFLTVRNGIISNSFKSLQEPMILHYLDRIGQGLFLIKNNHDCVQYYGHQRVLDIVENYFVYELLF